MYKFLETSSFGFLFRIPLLCLGKENHRRTLTWSLQPSTLSSRLPFFTLGYPQSARPDSLRDAQAPATTVAATAETASPPVTVVASSQYSQDTLLSSLQRGIPGLPSAQQPQLYAQDAAQLSSTDWWHRLYLDIG
ncbi:hypothetical protein BsWGS_01920 [Bradybaena similaris]